MRNFLATVLSVIAAGVMLIAYGLLSPRVAAPDLYSQARPMPASWRADGIEDLTLRQPLADPISDVRAVPAFVTRPMPADDLRYASAPAPRAVTRRALAPIMRSSTRNWAKTAMVIGGSSAAGAGLGAIFGGKKGALIGAALGGGAGTLFEVRSK